MLHPFEKQMRSAQECRNGPRCRYLAGGVYSFFHRGYGVQPPRNEQPATKLVSNKELPSNLTGDGVGFKKTVAESLIVSLNTMRRIFPN